MEGKVKEIAKDLENQYKEECSEKILQCAAKSYNLCEGTGPRACLDNFPTPPGCLNDGITLAE